MNRAVIIACACGVLWIVLIATFPGLRSGLTQIRVLTQAAGEVADIVWGVAVILIPPFGLASILMRFV